MHYCHSQTKNDGNSHDNYDIHTSFEEDGKKQRKNNSNKSYIVDDIMQDNEIFTLRLFCNKKECNQSVRLYSR